MKKYINTKTLFYLKIVVKKFHKYFKPKNKIKYKKIDKMFLQVTLKKNLFIE